MALSYGPSIITDGLVLALDAADPMNYNLTAVEVLVVAGGGGGGTGGGGGGAGGLIYNSNFAVTPGSAVTVTVGGGGAGASGWGSAGGFGGNSVFGSLTAIGGGAGLHRAGATNSGTGGSGGGDAGGSGYTLSNATAGQGFSGGNSPENGITDEEPGGGGGGAGGPGENASTPTTSNSVTIRATAAGAGGPGLGFNISGTFTYYAGGGGGSNRNGVGKPGGIGGGGTGGASPTAGTPNTGGGGGGTGFSGYGGGTDTGAAGGSGIVIVRYPGPQRAIGGTVSSIGGHTIHTFTTVGSTTFTPLVATNNSAILGLADLSGNNNFAKAENSPIYSSANGGSVSFDGTNDYINGNIILGQNATIEFIAKANWNQDNSGTPIPVSIDGNNYSSGPQPYFYFNKINWNTGNGGNNPFSNSYIPDTNWHVFTISNDFSSGVATLYIDGVLIGTATSLDMTTTDSNKLWIGRWHGGGYNVNMNFAALKIYNKALTATEIQQNFNALRGRFGI
jgi:hypothetical protein